MVTVSCFLNLDLGGLWGGISEGVTFVCLVIYSGDLGKFGV